MMGREATLVIFEEEMEGRKDVEEGVCISLAISLFKLKKKKADLVGRIKETWLQEGVFCFCKFIIINMNQVLTM